MHKAVSVGLAALACAAFAAPAAATTFADPNGDFLASYTGTHLAELDVLSFTIAYDYPASTFVLSAKVAGRIHAEGGLYVIGVNTGAGASAPFGGIGAPDVRFDQVVILQNNGTNGLVTGPGGGALGPGALSFVDDTFTVRVPSALLVSTGFSLGNYGFNLWARSGLGNNNQISDFAPDNATLRVGTIPEPAMWATMLIGFATVGFASRRRQRMSEVSA